jgi:hypothetical protein
VDVIVLPSRGTVENGRGILELLDSLPGSKLTVEQWEKRDAEIQRERSSWDR